MAIKEPESMDDLIYFTNRQLDHGNGYAKAWVYKGVCPKCRKGTMGKPKDEKTGKVKIRAKEYVCANCGYVMDKKENDEQLLANIKYGCPYCKNQGEVQIPFKRKKIDGVDALRFQCQKCNADIDVIKKMKNKKDS